MKIERKKISDQVLEHIKQMLKSKQFTVNEPLPSENEFAKLFGVSRAPVREALSVLQASGIIETRQGGRTYMKEVNLNEMLDDLKMEYISLDQVFELLEMRMVVEPQAAALAAKRRNDNDLKRMKEALNQFQLTLTQSGEIGDKADVLFHKYVMTAAKNSFMIRVMDNVDTLYRKAISYSLEKNVGHKETQERVFKEHQNIYHAIEAGQSEDAEKWMRAHLQNVIKKLHKEEIDGF